jgi:hypothetical protein
MNVAEPPLQPPIKQPPFLFAGTSVGSGTMPGPLMHAGFWQSPITLSGGVQPLELLAAELAAVLAAELTVVADVLLDVVPDVLLDVVLPVVLTPPLPPLPLLWLVEPPCPALLAAPPDAVSPLYPL